MSPKLPGSSSPGCKVVECIAPFYCKTDLTISFQSDGRTHAHTDGWTDGLITIWHLHFAGPLWMWWHWMWLQPTSIVQQAEQNSTFDNLYPRFRHFPRPTRGRLRRAYLPHRTMYRAEWVWVRVIKADCPWQTTTGLRSGRNEGITAWSSGAKLQNLQRCCKVEPM